MTKQKFYWILICLIILGGVPWLGAESLVFDELTLPDSLSHRIFWSLRIPRLLCTLALGGVLAMVGAIYQSVFKNPLCDPYILGVSSAVLAGVALGETFFGQSLGSPGSFIWGVGSGVVLVSVLMLFSLSRHSSPERVVLFGIGANFFLSSVLFVILSFQNQSVGGGTLKWFFGFLPWTPWELSLQFLVASLMIGVAFTAYARRLDVLRLGDSVARTLSVSPVMTRNLYLLATSLVVAITVSFSGTIGFVGLIIPQVCKLIFKPQSMVSMIPICFLAGASFLSLADGLSRSLVPPYEFPVGIVTTLLGGPLFLMILWRKSK